MRPDPAHRPSEHEPRRKRPTSDATERLRNLYRTGDESGMEPPDNGEAFQGLLPERRR